MIKKLRPSFIFRSFANRVVSSKRLSGLIYKLSKHKILARLLFYSIEKGPLNKFNKANPSVLCVKRNLFDKDIKELRKHAKRLNWLTIGTTQLASIQSAWTPKEIRGQTVFQKYFTEKYEPAWEECRFFAEIFLKLTIRLLNVKAVLSANMDYSQDEGLRRACKSIGIPFLVLAKENYLIPRFKEELIEYYKKSNFKFTGDGVAVFSQSMKDFIINGGISEAGKIFVTGAPRHDAWESIKENQYVRDAIVLLPYGKDYGLKSDIDFPKMLDLFLSFSKKYSDSGINFIIKCKDNKYKFGLEKKLAKTDLQYIKITVDQPLYELFPHSRLIIGCNTLALLEALLSEAVIAIPQWGEIGKDIEGQVFDPRDKVCSDLIEFAYSISEMEKLLDSAVISDTVDINMEKRLDLLQRYIYYEPGKYNSRNVEDFVLSQIKFSR